LSRLSTFPAFAPWLADLVATERLVRDGELPRGDDNVYLPAWTDSAIAEALQAATELSYAENVDPVTGQLLDKVVFHVAAMAARRLRARDFIAKSVANN
jgi:hypothetical protein